MRRCRILTNGVRFKAQVRSRFLFWVTWRDLVDMDLSGDLPFVIPMTFKTYEEAVSWCGGAEIERQWVPARTTPPAASAPVP